MKPPLLNPAVADLAPDAPELTVYDEEHAVTYMRMLDAEAEGADWREVCRIVLKIDPEHYPSPCGRAPTGRRRAWRTREADRSARRWVA